MRNLIIIAFLLVFSSCLRLDSFLYNPDTSIEAYGYDSYEGEVEIEVGPEYTIADSMIHPLTFQSDPSGDDKKNSCRLPW